jgi:hypothetical protein
MPFEMINGCKVFYEVGECHLVGLCEGGVIGIDYAANFPQQVNQLLFTVTLEKVNWQFSQNVASHQLPCLKNR